MNQRKITQHLKLLAEQDAHLAAVLERCGFPPPRIRPAGFETFLSTIISQQISTQAAATIGKRVFALMPQVSAESLLQLNDGALRAAGMSQRKIEYAQSLARAIVEETFVPEQLADMDDQSAIEAITQLRGFGVWSAEIYLMFSLGREDIFPADDLIIRQALKKMKRKRKDVNAKQAREIVKKWAPYRSAASLLLWRMHHQGLLKG